MTEFTKEFIEEQRKIIRNGTMTALQMKGNNEIDLHINMMYRRAKQEHCEKYYPEALDEIERLQKENKELKEFVDATRPTGICEICTSNVISRYEPLQARVQELEIHNKDFHLACINALDLHRESDVPKLKDIPNIIEELRTRVQELEQERRKNEQIK